jgi:iron-sulfur cluster assembly protein
MSAVVQQASSSITTITLSEAATHRVTSYLATQGVQFKGIRLSIKKTGCSGLSYVIDYVQIPQNNDVVIPLVEDYWIAIEKASYPYLKGMHIDYVKQGLNQKFVFNNPNQTGQCGCGESFTVE